MIPSLIYCAAGNRRFAEIALRHGYRYGAQLPNKVYFPPAFMDQDFKGYNKARDDDHRTNLRAAYFSEMECYRPRLATVLDWERDDQLPEILSWAEQAAQFVTEAVIIIPKVVGGITRLPRFINGKQVRLGYSSPTSFAGTPVSLNEFSGWPIHCLGGSVAEQLRISREADVISADGNFIQRLALPTCQFYCPAIRGKNRMWPNLREASIFVEHDAPYLAFELTCIAVPMAFRGCTGQEIWEAQFAFLESIDKYPTHLQNPLLSTIETKICSKCHDPRPLSQFYHKDQTRLRSECIDCYNGNRANRRSSEPKVMRPLRTPEQREQHRIATRRQRLAKSLLGGGK